MGTTKVKRIAAAVLFFSVAGCVAPGIQSLQENLKPGATLDQSERIKVSCEQKAIREVPAAYTGTETRVSTAPGSTTCGYDYSGRAVCRDYGGTATARTSVVDANQSLRERVYYQCLNDNGLMLYTAPACSPEQLARFNSQHSDLRNYKTPRPNPQMCFLTSNFHAGKLTVAVP
jgi:hypothetical protein